MKYMEIVLFVLIINLSFAGISAMGLGFQNIRVNLDNRDNQISQYSEEQIAVDGIHCADVYKEKTLACKIEYEKTKTLRDRDVKPNIVDTATDFWQGLNMFRTIFVDGLLLPGRTYRKFFETTNCKIGDKCEIAKNLQPLEYIINTLVAVMYFIAMIQILSGRSMENNM